MSVPATARSPPRWPTLYAMPEPTNDKEHMPTTPAADTPDSTAHKRPSLRHLPRAIAIVNGVLFTISAVVFATAAVVHAGKDGDTVALRPGALAAAAALTLGLGIASIVPAVRKPRPSSPT